MAKRCVQRLYKHGNATAVTLPRYLLFDLGWVAGQMVMIERLADGTLWVRPPALEDFSPVSKLRPPAPKLAREFQIAVDDASTITPTPESADEPVTR